MADRKSDFALPTLDDLFSTQEERDDARLEKIRDIPLGLIDDFPDHPFHVRDIVSIDDVMSMLHIGRSAVYSLLRNQSIKNVMVARKYIIPKKSVIRFLEETTA